VDYASHSAQVAEIEAELAKLLGPVAPRSCRVPFCSSLTGEVIDTASLDGAYWYANLRSPVEFEAAARVLLAGGSGVFIEVSPHPVLGLGLQETFDDAGVDAVALGTLRRGEGGPRRFLASLAAAHAAGVAVDWGALFAGSGARKVDLPTYAFQRQRYWIADHSVPFPVAAGPGQSGPPADQRFWETVEREDLDSLSELLGAGTPQAALVTALGDVLPALSSWRRASRDSGAMADWNYEIAWHPVPVSVPGQLTGRWLVIGPETETGQRAVDACAGALARHGASAVPLVIAAARCDRDMLAGTLEEVLSDESVPAGEPAPLSGILSLFALDEEPHPDVPAVPRGYAATLALIQALGARGAGVPLWCATRGAVSAAAGDVMHPWQALVWGLGRVAALEDPDGWGGLIDLPPVLDEAGPDEEAGLDEQAAALLATVLAGETGEDQLALRPGGIFARRLCRASSTGDERRQAWRPAGTVLITGGTGGLGRQVARWLAGAGADHLLLVSRRGPGAAGVAQLQAELAALGARVTTTACDAGDRDALAQLLASVPESSPLTAVVHTAAVLDDGVIPSLRLDQLDRVLRAKAGIALNLHELTSGLDLSAFVLFASYAGIVGASGQGNYAPGNAFLDALALHRREQGRPATSVAWGAWGGGGMADGEFGDTLRRHGLREMPPGLAAKALHRAVERGDTCPVIADVDWGRFFVAFTATRNGPLLSGVPEVQELIRAERGHGPDNGAGGTTELPALAARLAGLSAAEQDAAIVEVVRTQVADILGFAGPEMIDAKRAFQDLGFDSVTAVELRNRLRAMTGLRLPVTLVFDHPEPGRLARYLRERLTENGETAVASMIADLEKIEAALAAVAADDTGRARVMLRMQALVSDWQGSRQPDSPAAGQDIQEAASDEEMFDLLGKKFGIS
jgi:NAD(P)-dependent dehydrogenase (short-subunit alcohol dehydrogenase family)